MTWGEFKKMVEAEGITDEDELDYIDRADRVPGATIYKDKDRVVAIYD